jgi:hypothetical protein
MEPCTLAHHCTRSLDLSRANQYEVSIHRSRVWWNGSVRHGNALVILRSRTKTNAGAERTWLLIQSCAPKVDTIEADLCLKAAYHGGWSVQGLCVDQGYFYRCVYSQWKIALRGDNWRSWCSPLQCNQQDLSQCPTSPAAPTTLNPT